MEYNINECVDAINTQLALQGLEANMNARLLRHYQGNAIPKPRQEGKFAKYSQEHVEAVVALRKAQGMGVSSKAYSTFFGQPAANRSVDNNASRSLQNVGANNNEHLQQGTSEQKNALSALSRLGISSVRPSISKEVATSSTLPSTKFEVWPLGKSGASVAIPKSTLDDTNNQGLAQLDDWLRSYPLN